MFMLALEDRAPSERNVVAASYVARPERYTFNGAGYKTFCSSEANSKTNYLSGDLPC
jgi:hypothetical protein